MTSACFHVANRRYLMAKQALKSPSAGQDPKLRDALDHMRVSAQELDSAISGAMTKHKGTAKADLSAIEANTASPRY